MPHDESILVVEDDDDIREAIATFLEAEGHSVVAAGNGEEALHLLRSQRRFCLILLDLFMPVKNGWEFRAEQLGDPRIADVPVIVISADQGARQKAATLGAIDCMIKPIDFDELLAVVAAHC